MEKQRIIIDNHTKKLRQLGLCDEMEDIVFNYISSYRNIITTKILKQELNGTPAILTNQEEIEIKKLIDNLPLLYIKIQEKYFVEELKKRKINGLKINELVNNLLSEYGDQNLNYSEVG